MDAASCISRPICSSHSETGLLIWRSRGLCVPCSGIWVAAFDYFLPERAEKRCM